jgi:EthD domain
MQMATDYSARDHEAKVAFYVLLWKRHGITQEMFDDYWRDVHGPVCARLPGQYQYWQFHVAPNEGGLFPAVAGVNYTSTDEDQFAGIAELTFRSPEDRQTWFQAANILMADEHNIFSKAIGYVTTAGHSKTYVDRIEVGAPNGRLGLVKFHVMVKQGQDVSVEAFRKYMTESFATTVATSDLVLKLRQHLFEPPDVSRPDAAGVTHFEAPGEQYQAAFEIAFKNHLDMEAFFASDTYAAAVKDQAKYVKQVSAFPERDPYTFVYHGKMTLPGQRGSRTAELITKIGAVNQLQDDILDLMVGKGI